MQDGAASCSAATRKARTWNAVGKPQFPVGGLLAKLALPTTKLVLAASLATELKGAVHNADVNPLRVLSRPLRSSSFIADGVAQGSTPTHLKKIK